MGREHAKAEVAGPRRRGRSRALGWAPPPVGTPCRPWGRPGRWSSFRALPFPSGFEPGPPAASQPRTQTPRMCLSPWEATVTQLLASKRPRCQRSGTH